MITQLQLRDPDDDFVKTAFSGRRRRIPSMTPDRYRKRPVEVEAMQVTVTNIDHVGKWIADNGGAVAGLRLVSNGLINERHLIIGTLEGEMRANPGDYVIRGTAGEFYPCAESIFKQIYERVA